MKALVSFKPVDKPVDKLISDTKHWCPGCKKYIFCKWLGIIGIVHFNNQVLTHGMRRYLIVSLVITAIGGVEELITHLCHKDFIA